MGVMPCRRRFPALSSRSVISLLGVFALATGAGVFDSDAPAAATTVQPVPGLKGGLNAVACMTSTSCVAVGAPSINGSDVVPITNGVPGSVLDEDDIHQLNGVACPTATECLAVGQDTSFGVNNALGTILPIPYGSGPNGTANDVSGTSNLEGVSCATATTCMAIGTDVNGASLVVTLVNGLPVLPVTHGAFLYLQLSAIACPSETTCYIVGQDTRSSEGFLVPIDPGTQVIGTEQLVSGSTELNSISCASTTVCVAAGSVGAAANSTGVVVPITSGTPGTAQMVSGASDLSGVACPSATLCEAVGYAQTTSIGTVVPIANGEAGAPFTLSQALLGVDIIACPGATSCDALGVQLTDGTTIVLPMTPPTTTVALPSNGATLAGSLYLDAAASDNLGVTQVNYVLSGGTYNNTVISGSTPTYFGSIGSWDTTTVPNGTYTLQSVATDVEGFSTTSAPITVTVNNQPPTTAVLLPSNGATLSGAQYLDASASSLAGIKSVSFEITGGTLNDQVISGSTPTYFGWIGAWNTTTVPNGTYTLESVATDVDGRQHDQRAHHDHGQQPAAHHRRARPLERGDANQEESPCSTPAPRPG